MKKLLFFLTMVAVLLTSCAKDDVTMPQPEGSNLVSFKVSSPEMQTRYGEGTTANKLMWAVYFEGKLLEDVSALTLDKAQEMNLSTEVVLDLVNGLTYDILFWAQAEDAPYAFDGEKVTIDYASLTANEEKYDAFFKNYKAVIDDSTPHSVELKRPFAQLNIGTGDIDKAEKAGFILENTSITVETCTVLDLVTGVASEPKEMTFAMNTKSDDTYKEYEIIALNYLLVNSEKAFIDVTFEAEGSSDSINREYLNVPIQRNHRTYILGDLLTKSSMFEVFINPIFDGDIVVQNVIYYTSTDGKIVQPYKVEAFGLDLIGNSYKDGQGRLEFNGPVTKIGYAAFKGCSTLKSVVLPDGMTQISQSVFEDCVNLTSVNIPEGVTVIDHMAFSGCSGLKNITIPASVTETGSTFGGCKNLKRVDITDLSAWCKIDFYPYSGNPLCYGAKLYLNGEEVTELIIPSDITEIKRCSFDGCHSITSVILHDGVTKIGQDAFDNCVNLSSVNIPDSVIEIGGVFDGWKNLARVDITDLSAWCKIEFKIASANPLYNGAKLYLNGEEITELTIPSDITEIENYTFYNYSYLTNLTIPDGVTSVGSGAFYRCSGLTTLTIPDSVTSVGYQAFYDCKGLASVTIGRGLTAIGEYMLAGCENLSNVTILGEVTKIGSCAFSGCASLTNVTLPDSLIEIDYYAFGNCSSLTEIIIPDGVTTIGHTAFSDCISLTNVTIPDSVTSMGSMLFDGCGNLESVTIGKGVTSIAYGTFRNCKNLTSVTIGGDITSIDESAFSNCAKLSTISIPDSVTSIGASAFYNCGSLTGIDIPDSVTSIGASAFYCCDALTSITIPDGVTEICANTFYYCTNLKDVNIGSNVTTIGDSAFEICRALESITIPDTVKSIGKEAFYGCEELKNVYCRPMTPPTGGVNMFKYNWSHRKIYVHAEAEMAYKEAEYWSDYSGWIWSYDYTD